MMRFDYQRVMHSKHFLNLRVGHTRRAAQTKISSFRELRDTSGDSSGFVLLQGLPIWSPPRIMCMCTNPLPVLLQNYRGPWEPTIREIRKTPVHRRGQFTKRRSESGQSRFPFKVRFSRSLLVLQHLFPLPDVDEP